VASLKTAEPSALLSAEAARATVFVKAGELIRAKGPPRPAVLRFLAALLAKNVAPALPASDADADALAALADALCGKGFALQPAGSGVVPMAEALAAADLQPPGLTSAERAAVLAGAAPSIALVAVAVARARKLLPAAEAVSALSCEVRPLALRCAACLRRR
jgi:histidine ammonia-lyase